MRTVFSEANYDDYSRSRERKEEKKKRLKEIYWKLASKRIDVEFSRHGSLPREIKRHPVVESSNSPADPPSLSK